MGKYLSELCLTHNLKLLNGRTIGDLTGKYTCYKYNGNSIVDYIMTQTTLLQKVVHFKVKPITLWSDHCEIQAELAIKKRSSLGNTKPIKNSKVKEYRWENTLKNKVSNIIYGHEFKFLVKQPVHSLSVNLEEKVQKVTNRFIQVRNKCLRMVKIKKKKSKNHEYFDSDSYNKRKEL